MTFYELIILEIIRPAAIVRFHSSPRVGGPTGAAFTGIHV
jgi:hypothetical protein